MMVPEMSEILKTKLFWIIATALAIYLYLRIFVFNYWQSRGVPCESPTIPLGNIPFTHFLGKISLGTFIKENYKKFSSHPFHGFYMFHKPIIVINDPELIKIILVEEFNRFQNRGWFHNDKVDALLGNLFVLPGEKWKRLRAKLSPIFTSKKLKEMYRLFTEVSNELVDACDAELKQTEILEMKDIITRYTTDVISSIVYGLKPDSLKHPNNEFNYNGHKAFMCHRLSLLIGIFTPDVMEKLDISLFEKSTQEFFISTFKDIVHDRRKTGIERKDFLNLLMQLVDIGEVEDDDEKPVNGIKNDTEKLNLTQAAAQAFIFFAAGYEAASSTVTYALLELAMNPEIQDKLRKEVDQMAETTGINYENVTENEYLEMVLTETLRKHPSFGFLNRICEGDFQIPNSNFTIPKGMRVLFSVAGIHRNPEFYPNPDRFDPMRFSKENIAKSRNYLYLGFGEGPRYCIGKRFGQLQTKQAIVTMLRHYKFYISEKTQIPANYATNSMVQLPESGVYLRVEKRNL